MPVKRLLAVAVASVTVVALLPANVRLIALVAVVLAATVSVLVVIERSATTDTILTPRVEAYDTASAVSQPVPESLSRGGTHSHQQSPVTLVGNR